jgi:hypothetical protein
MANGLSVRPVLSTPFNVTDAWQGSKFASSPLRVKMPARVKTNSGDAGGAGVQSAAHTNEGRRNVARTRFLMNMGCAFVFTHIVSKKHKQLLVVLLRGNLN